MAVIALGLSLWTKVGFFAYPLGIVHFSNAPPEWTEAFFCTCLMSQNLSDHLKLESWNMK